MHRAEDGGSARRGTGLRSPWGPGALTNVIPDLQRALWGALAVADRDPRAFSPLTHSDPWPDFNCKTVISWPTLTLISQAFPDPTLIGTPHTPQLTAPPLGLCDPMGDCDHLITETSLSDGAPLTDPD